MHSLHRIYNPALPRQVCKGKVQPVACPVAHRLEHAALSVFHLRQKPTGEQPLTLCMAAPPSSPEGGTPSEDRPQAAEAQEQKAEAEDTQNGPQAGPAADTETGEAAAQPQGGEGGEGADGGESGNEGAGGAEVQAEATGEVEQGAEADVEEEEGTLPVEILNEEEAILRMFDYVHEHADLHYHAFFSSELGGVVTEPALMMVHIDDHMVHRGHGVFDTALVIDGNLYMLDRHLLRLADSADRAGIELPCSLQQLKRIITETVAASKKMNGMVRYWLGGGRGNFGLSPKNCLSTSFYCIMTTLVEGNPTLNPDSDYLRGRKVKTSPVPIKDPYFATLKSTNYLPNVLAVMDAEAENLDYGIFVDALGNIAEGPNMNVAILTKEGVLVVPPFTQTLPGITLLRLVELLEQKMESVRVESKGLLTSYDQRPFNKWDVFDAKEAFLIGSTTYVTSIVQWDGKDLGEGSTGDEPGLVSLILRAMIKNDMEPLDGPRENFTEVDYGILTNME